MQWYNRGYSPKIFNLKSTSCSINRGRDKVIAIRRHRKRLNGIRVPLQCFYTFARPAVPQSHLTIHTTRSHIRCTKPCQTWYSILCTRQNSFKASDIGFSFFYNFKSMYITENSFSLWMHKATSMILWTKQFQQTSCSQVPRGNKCSISQMISFLSMPPTAAQEPLSYNFKGQHYWWLGSFFFFEDEHIKFKRTNNS